MALHRTALAPGPQHLCHGLVSPVVVIDQQIDGFTVREVVGEGRVNPGKGPLWEYLVLNLSR
ncbi:MAG: hypothetical protein AMXMBFR80_01720 [Dehalococcoidia bacterium]